MYPTSTHITVRTAMEDTDITRHAFSNVLNTVLSTTFTLLTEAMHELRGGAVG